MESGEGETTVELVEFYAEVLKEDVVSYLSRSIGGRAGLNL